MKLGAQKKCKEVIPSDSCLLSVTILGADYGEIYSITRYDSKKVDENTFESSVYSYEGFKSPTDHYPLHSKLELSFRYQTLDPSFLLSFEFDWKNTYGYSVHFPTLKNVTVSNATISLDAMFGIFNVDIENQLIVRIGDLHFTKLNQTLNGNLLGSQIASPTELNLNLNLTYLFETINSTSFSIQFYLGNTEARFVKFSDWAFISYPSSFVLQDDTNLEFYFMYLDPLIPKFKMEIMNQVRVQDIEDSYNKRPGFEYTILKSYMFYENNIDYDNLLRSFIRYNFNPDGKFIDIYGRNVTIDINSISCGARTKTGYKYGDVIYDYSFEELRGYDFAQCDRGTFKNNSLIVFYGKVLNGPLPPIPSPSPIIEKSIRHDSNYLRSSHVGGNGMDDLYLGIGIGVGLLVICIVIIVIGIVIFITMKKRQHSYQSIQ